MQFVLGFYKQIFVCSSFENALNFVVLMNTDFFCENRGTGRKDGNNITIYNSYAVPSHNGTKWDSETRSRSIVGDV